LHLVGALDRPTSGTVRIAGHDLSRMGDAALSGLRSHHIGFVFQQFVLVGGQTALDNVATGLLYRGVPAAVRRARARSALERVGLADRTGHRPGQLSGGEQQRVAIARALVGEPTIILADEPTGNLDSVAGAAIMRLLHALHDDGATIGVVTHDRGVAAGLPRTIAIRDGCIESDDSAGALA
ncbi:MAG TPA: ATP-binding cassette domain-containing protein, partial [Euzebya sp.]|nr:ATP-binding cassette domain-containing protein [Euzebya sp.]